MLTIAIKDFQAVERETLVVDGFTALVGRSNIGKSAIIRAIDAALTGAPADSFVRHGQYCLRTIKGSKTCKCFCSVHMQTAGFDLLWEKGDNVNRYVYNGKEYTAVSRGTPDFLGPEFQPVKLGSEKKLLQVSDQFFPIFLLDQSGSVVADVLSDVAHLDRINTAIRLAEKDRRDAASERKVREKDLITYKKRVSDFEGLDTAAGKVLQVEKSELLLRGVVEKVDHLDRYIEVLYATVRRIQSLKTIESVVHPEIKPIQGRGTAFTQVCRLLSTLQDKQQAVSSLSGVGSIPVLEFNPVQGKSRAFTQLAKFAGSLPEKQGIVVALSGVDTILPPDLEPSRKVFGTYQKLESWLAKVKIFKDLVGKFKDLEGVRVTPDTEGMNTALKRYTQILTLSHKSETLSQVISDLVAKDSLLSLEEKQVQQEADALGVCPTCAQPIISVACHA